ncbi:MAG: peptidylprolyl isomerase [Candidatus Dormibacteraceae bacterium]
MSTTGSPPAMAIDVTAAHTCKIHTSQGDFTLALDAAAAPVTVNNFVHLANRHFYDGLIFHRVEPGFVIQGGDPQGDGRGGPDYRLPDETNPASWERGSVGMASSSAGVNGSQFFVVLADAPHLSRSGAYNHFGLVTQGQEVVDKIRVGDVIQSIDVVVS